MTPPVLLCQTVTCLHFRVSGPSHVSISWSKKDQSIIRGSFRDHCITALALWPVNTLISSCLSSNQEIMTNSLFRLIFIPRRWYIHMLSGFFFTLQITQKEKSTYVKRPCWSFIYTIIWCDSGMQLGDVRVDSHDCTGGIQGGCPGSYAWQWPCVNPARGRPVQLTKLAGSTPRHVLLISFSSKVIRTSFYTHTKKCKVALFTQASHVSYVSVCGVFLFAVSGVKRKPHRAIIIPHWLFW